MCFDQIAKIIELIIAAVGVILVVFGWIVPYQQSKKLEQTRSNMDAAFRQRQWEKELVDTQIAEFYGPISALLQEQDILYKHVLEMLGRKHVFSSNQTKITDLSEKDQKIWIHFVDEYKIPLNNRIIGIIRDKKHLIYKSEIPNCFQLYLDYSVGWEFLDNQKRHDVPNYYEYYYSSREFNTYINQTLKTLLAKQAELIGTEQTL